MAAPLPTHGGPAAAATGQAGPNSSCLLPWVRRVDPGAPTFDADVGHGCARIVYKNPWVRKLKIGIRAKRESTDGKGDILCITFKG